MQCERLRPAAMRAGQAMLGLLVVALSLAEGSELRDYCTAHRFDNLPGGLGFTKEVVGTEYADVDSFKAMHCCLRGYRSIEWYKDGRPYPWPKGESSFILYPESANQTIYTQSVRTSDAGRYACRARNDTSILESEITLGVIGEHSSGYKGRPLPTYRPSSQLVPIGGTARLFCEAYIGRVYVPDARISVTWRKSSSNKTLPNNGRVSQYKVSRERDQIVGSYLVIEEIVSEDYGEYMCQVSNGVDDDEIKIHAHLLRQDSHSILGFHKGSWHKSLLLSILVLALFCSVAAVYVRCWLPLTLFWRDKFIAPEENDGKEWDALICYRERDSVYVIESIIPTLETKYHYKCTPLKLSDSSQSWHSDIGPLASRARRLLLVLDSDSTRSSTGALGQLCQLGRPPVLLLVGDLHPHPNRPRQQQLFSKSFQSTCELIECLGPGEDRCDFWHRLRLALPPTPRRRRSSRQDAVVNEQQLRPRDALELIV